ncbi:MAG TPA: S1 family peptidase [Mycobacteriales bacterium]|nr:S1 family peptidase [Mycobacteriales bacterium]
MVRFLVALAALLAVALGAAPAQAAPAAVEARAVTVAGGDTLTNAGGRCTLGFNVTGRGILAGRCGPVGTRWSAGATPVGFVSTVFASTGLTLITIDNPAVVQLHGIRTGATVIAISAAANSFVGQQVKVVSPVSGLHSGVVTALNATITFPEGTITGLVRSTICPDSGGVGAPIFAGTSGLSMVLGGSGNCTSGGTTYSQPITPLLAQTGRAIF